MFKIDKILQLLLIPYDKALHALYGLIFYSVIALYSQFIAIVAVFTIAIVKEVYDGTNSKHTRDVKDFLATVTIPIILYLLGGTYV